MKTPNDNLLCPLAVALIALALNSIFIEQTAAQAPVTIFTNSFDALSGTAPGYSYGDVANPSHNYVNGAGVGGSVGARISGDFVAPGLGYGGIAFQFQNTAVTKNTDTNLSHYVLSFDAKANRDNGGFQIMLQTWSGTGFTGTGPLTSSSLSDVILGPSNTFVHCTLNLGTKLSAGASATAKTWQIAFVMDEAYFGGPGVGNQLVIDNVAVTMGGPLWTPTGSLNTPRVDYQNNSTLLPDGTVLIEGGYDFGTLASAELYNPTNGMWTYTGSMHYARDYQTTTLLNNGRVLVAGGINFPTEVSVSEIYDPATHAWAGTNSLNDPRFSHTATLLANGKVLVTGGVGNGGVKLSSAELYDPATNQWSYTGSMTTNRVFHTATLLNNGKVLVAGGQDSDFLGGAELYDPGQGTWTATGPMNYARESHTATLLLNGKVLVAGGVGPAGYAAIAEMYDPASGAWSVTGSLNTPRQFHTATLLPNGKVLVVGGQGAYDSAELYDPATGTWSPTSSLNVGRDYHAATLLANGQVLIAAGTDPSLYPLASAELYNPAIVTGTTVSLINGANLSNGVFQFAFTNTPGASFNVFGTTNPSLPFSDWTGVGSVTEISSGHYQFNDAGTTNYPNYFYRVRSP